MADTTRPELEAALVTSKKAGREAWADLLVIVTLLANADAKLRITEARFAALATSSRLAPKNIAVSMSLYAAIKYNLPDLDQILGTIALVILMQLNLGSIYGGGIAKGVAAPDFPGPDTTERNAFILAVAKTAAALCEPQGPRNSPAWGSTRALSPAQASPTRPRTTPPSSRRPSGPAPSSRSRRPTSSSSASSRR